MVNDASRRSHDFKDELGGKPEWLGVYCERALKLHPSGKAFRGKPRSKPESGNPTFRDCRGARGNVTCQLLHGARASALSRPRELGSFHPVAIETAAEATKLSELSMERVARRLGERAGHNVSER
jgi:hypothetical protein